MDMDEIVPGVWQGGALDKKIVELMLPTANSASLTRVTQVIDSKPDGIKAILNLCIEYQDTLPADDLMVYKWLPIPKEPKFPGIEWLEGSVEFIEYCKKLSWPILVHCATGFYRASLVVTGYLMKTEKLSPEDALTKLKSKRKVSEFYDEYQKGLQTYFIFLKNAPDKSYHTQ